MPTENPLVSIIITTYNRSRLLREAIDSVIGQTYPNIEILVVDDGSTDDTEAVVNSYGGRVGFHRQKNQGPAAARNAGIRLAQGKYIGFLDDDDTYLPPKIAKQVALLERRPDLGLAHCRYASTDPDGRWLEKSGLLPEGYVFKELLCGCFIMVHTPLARRECIQQVGGFSVDLPSAEDWDFWLRLARAGFAFGGVQEVLCTYRMANTGTLMGDVPRQETNTMNVLGRFFSAADLAEDVAAVKDKAYGLNYLWIGGRYFTTRAWEEGWRCLQTACAAYPPIGEPQIILAHYLRDMALGLRVIDPLEMLAGMLDHCPAQFQGVADLRPYLIGQVCLGLALKCLAAGDSSGAQAYLRQAAQADPHFASHPEQFIEVVYATAFKLAVASPAELVRQVYAALPAEWQPLVKVRRLLLAKTYLEMARENQGTDRADQSLGQILQACRLQPRFLVDRGVWGLVRRSIFTA